MKKIKKEKFESLDAYEKALLDLEDANKAVVDANEHARKMSLAVRKAKANRTDPAQMSAQGKGVPNG